MSTSHQPNATASSSSTNPSKHKKSKRDGKDKDKEKKHKSKHASASASASASSSKLDKSPFEHRTSRMRLAIAPKFSADVMSGVREKLDGMIMRYVHQMGGVLLAHWDHTLDDDTAKIINECPYSVCHVEFQSILWAPKLGQKLYGTHSLSSPSHLSLLFNKTFNISIPLQHIPTDLYEFEQTDEVLVSDSDDDEEVVFAGFGSAGALGHGSMHEAGRWKEKASGKVLGAGGKGIKFTVIGIQVTNQMLSLTGSLLADPTNPPPPPEPVATVAAPSPSPSPSPSPEPEPAARPTKQRKEQQHQSEPAMPIAEDYSHLSARDQKKRRKEEEKAKRDARKAKKDEKVLETVQSVAAEKMVDVNVTPVEQTEGEKQAVFHSKRKAGGEDGEKRKKKKEQK